MIVTYPSFSYHLIPVRHILTDFTDERKNHTSTYTYEGIRVKIMPNEE